MLSQKILLLTVVLVFFAGSGMGQNAIGRLNELSLKKEVPFTVTEYSTRDGLTQSQIIDITENSDGSLFLSTANGICSFNGYEFREINIDKKYRYHFFDHIFWSDKYHILYGKDFNTSKIVQLLPEYQLKSDGRYSLSFSTSQNDSMFLSDYNNELYYASIPDFKISKLHCKIPAPLKYMYYYNNVVYCATEFATYGYNIRTHTTQKLLDDMCIRLRVNPYDHRLYALTLSAVYVVGDSFRKVTDVSINGPVNSCTDMEFISSTEFYVGTRQGLFHFNAGMSSHYLLKDGLTSEAINRLYYNKTENCLFAGTGEKGLLKLQFKNAHSIFKNEGLSAASSVNSIIRASDGKVLMAENCCNVHELKGDTALLYNSLGGQFSCMSEVDGNLYCGTWGGGVEVMRGNKFIGSVISPALLGNVVFAVFKDQRGYIWIGTNRGVSRGKTQQTIAPVLPEIRSRINCMYRLKNGNICLGGEDGFYIVSQKGIEKTIGKREGLNAKEVRSFMEDAEGKLWIGTYGGGVYCYEQGRLTSINGMKNCMLFEDAFTLAADDFGQLFMSSNFGLWKISYRSLDDFYKGKTDYLVPEHYTQENGILNTEFNGGFQNNFLKTSPNHFYFPSIEGIIAVTPDPPTVRRLIPRIELVEKKENRRDSVQHVFERDVSVINFKASCVNFSDKFNVYFQYKVVKEDDEEEWSLPQKESLFSFYQLSPGNYKFVIRAIDGGNESKPVEQVFAFRILPYFYETTWFLVCVALLILIVTFLIIRWRIIKGEERLEKDNAVKRQLAELQLEGIQAQMNPHFVFNCLNTIQALFITGEIKLANEYTSKFSSLMRIIIEHIRKRKISIREEVEMLHIYLPLENIQMEDPFDFMIHVEPSIDKDKTLIHGMIIHTFVENAIKHGIKPLHGKKGMITVNFKKENGNVVVEIMDNGNGINHSVKKMVDRNHVSRGLQIIKDRINIINLLENINIYTETFDLNDLDKTKTGTLVKIIYPYST